MTASQHENNMQNAHDGVAAIDLMPEATTTSVESPAAPQSRGHVQIQGQHGSLESLGRGADDKDAHEAAALTAGKGVDWGTQSFGTEYDRHAAEVTDEAAIEAAGQETGTSYYIWTLTAISAVSGMLFGYDTGAINSVLVQVGTDIDNHTLSSGEKELITSALSVGAIIGSLLVGYLSDRLGRKRSLVFCDILFIAGAIVQAAISSKWPFVVGRFIMGIGVGAASMICPVFISEIAPVNVRGRLVTLNVVAITGGQVLATAIGAGFENVSSGWRWIIALGAAPPIIQGTLIEIFFPESPRHLQKTGRTEKAAAVLSKMYPKATPDQIKDKMMVLQRHIAADTKGVWSKYRDLLSRAQLRRASFLCIVLQTAQQFSGANSLLYYSATIFSLSGLNNSTATSLVVSGVNFIFTCLAVIFLDRFGRRLFLKVMIPIMIFGLVFASIVFHFITLPTGGYLRDTYHSYDRQLSAVMIVSMVIFIAAYAGGLGHVPWGAAGDMFDQDHRGVGASVGALTNWVCNTIIASTFLRLMDSITPAGTFGFYAGISFVLGVILFFTFPETLGLPLEQANSLLEGGFKVKRSEMLWKQNRKAIAEERRRAKASKKSQGGGAGDGVADASITA